MSVAPATKAARQGLIRQIVAHSRIHSQEELRETLSRHGIAVAQATLSRDLVELRATKIRETGGGQIYSIPEPGAPGQERREDGSTAEERITRRLARWCEELLVTAEHANGHLVLRTPPGAAQLLASAVDDAMLPGILGCIAGDDTVLVMATDEPTAAEVAAHLLRLAHAHA